MQAGKKMMGINHETTTAPKKKTGIVRKRKSVASIPSTTSTPCRDTDTPPIDPKCMRVRIDYRETDLYANCQEIRDIQKLTETFCPQVESNSLLLGDIEILNARGERTLLIERKTIADLIASIKDGRYAEQSYRLHHASQLNAHNIIYIIEGAISSKQKPSITKMVKSAIITLQLFKGFTVIRTNNVSETAGYIMDLSTRLAIKFDDGCLLYHSNIPISVDPPISPERDAVDTPPMADMQGGGYNPSIVPVPSYTTVVKAHKKKNVTHQNISTIMLSQIPGISPSVAEKLLDGRTLEEFIQRLRDGDRWLFQLKISLTENKPVRKLSRGIIESIYLYFFNTPPPVA